MKKITLMFAALVSVVGLTFAIAAPSYAVNVWDGSCKTNSSDEICGASKTDKITPLFQNILSLLMYAIGAVSVIMIVFGGIKFSTSNGDANSIQSAKNTILYSVIGLIVAILGQAIILFVVDWIK